MISLGLAWESLMPTMGRVLGDSAAHPGRGERVILRRPGSLEDVAGDATPRVMELAADAAAGAASVTLRLPSLGKLAGTMPAGARVTIGAVEYQAAADATAAAGATTLVVPISPVLAAPAATGLDVVVEPDALYTFEDCVVHPASKSDLLGEMGSDFVGTVTVPSQGAPTTPRLHDWLELEDGTKGRVGNIPVSTGGFWDLQMGG